MNLLVKKTGLIFGLALFLFACEEPGEIGLKLSPDAGDFITSSIEIPVNASTGVTSPYLVSDTVKQIFLNDTAISILNHRLIAVGKYQDPYFGGAEFTGYCSLLSRKDTLKVPDNANHVKSEISISLKNPYGYGPVYDDQIVRVFELDDTLNIVNYTSTTYPHKMDPISEMLLDIDTSYFISSKIYNSAVTDAFGEKLLEDAKNNVITNYNLNKFIKGLAFVPDASDNLLFHIDPNFTNTNLTVWFEDGGKEDSLVFYFSNQPGYSSVFDYSGTELDGLQENVASDNTQDIYLNSMGTFMELDLTNLTALRDSLGPMVINSAELHFEDAIVDSLYRVSSGINFNAYEKTPDFNFARQSFFKAFRSGNEYYTGINLEPYRFSMSILRKSDNLTNALVYVSSTVGNEYSPSTGRSPAFVDFIQSVVATNSKVDEAKYYLFLDSYGRSFQQIRFNKEKIRLKLYFSYLRDNI